MPPPRPWALQPLAPPRQAAAATTGTPCPRLPRWARTPPGQPRQQWRPTPQRRTPTPATQPRRRQQQRPRCSRWRYRDPVAGAPAAPTRAAASPSPWPCPRDSACPAPPARPTGTPPTRSGLDGTAAARAWWQPPPAPAWAWALRPQPPQPPTPRQPKGLRPTRLCSLPRSPLGWRARPT